MPGSRSLPARSEACMSCQLAITEKPGYLHCIVTGKNTMENVAAYLQELARECEARNCFRVLIEEHLVGRRLETWDVYQLVAEGGARNLGKFQATAYVDVNAEGDLMKFAETVASNRGLPMMVFATVPEAESWISSKVR
jgi:hypothetical protein